MDLKALAENPVFVVLSYLFSFGPWAILFALDFISPKWKTIRQTRCHGIWHFMSSVIPLGVALFYLVAQRAKRDYKEMMAAFVAVFVALYHICRTVSGYIQLQAYKSWCTKAVLILRMLDCEDKAQRTDIRRHRDWRCLKIPAVGRARGDDEVLLTIKAVAQDIDDQMLVNNQVVDNEIFSSELPIRLCFPRCGIVQGLKNICRGKLDDWFCCTDLLRCTLRWTIAVLSHYGRHWLHTTSSEDALYPETHLDLHLPYRMELPDRFHSVLRTQHNALKTDALFYNAGALDDVDCLLKVEEGEVEAAESRMEALRNISTKQVLLFLALVAGNGDPELVRLQITASSGPVSAQRRILGGPGTEQSRRVPELLGGSLSLRVSIDGRAVRRDRGSEPNLFRRFLNLFNPRRNAPSEQANELGTSKTPLATENGTSIADTQQIDFPPATDENSTIEEGKYGLGF